MGPSGEAAERSATARRKIELTKDSIPTGPGGWPTGAVAVVLVFGFLLAITVVGASVATSRISEERDEAVAALDIERERVDDLEREIIGLTSERDILSALLDSGTAGEALSVPPRVADHTPGTYVVGDHIAAGRWQADHPDCPYVRLEIASEKVIGKGDAGDGVVLRAGEKIVFERDCWWHFEGS